MDDTVLPDVLAWEGIVSRLGPHDDHPWHPLPWHGTFSKVLMFDRATGQTLELGKIAAGAVFPEHSHPTLQAQYLISGRLRLPSGAVIEPGAFNLIPAGQPHGPFEALEEAVSLKYFASVPEYVLSDGSRFRYNRGDGQPPLHRTSASARG